MQILSKLAVGLMVVAGCGVAQAADLPQRAPAPPPAYMPVEVPVYDWTGFYVGGNVGWGWTNASGTYSNPAVWPVSQNANSFIGGFQAGFNYQFNNIVLGVEGDWDWATKTANGVACTAVGCFAGSGGTNYIATLAGRFGVAMNNTLFYGKAGAGWVNNYINIQNGAGVTSWSGSVTNVGWLLGAGVEYGISRNWSAKLEYDYLRVGTWNTNPGLSAGDTLNVTRTISLVKAGINYRF